MKAAAAETAQTWKKGLAEWALSGDDIRELGGGARGGHLTPGFEGVVP